MRRDELSLPDPPPNDRPGDRWVCGSAGIHSGCARGPVNGVCPLAESCHPQRTWHGQRRVIAVVVVALFVAGVWLLSRGETAATVFKPGDLTKPHAQILAGTMVSQRCSACHPQAATSPVAWFSADQAGHIGVSQSDRCLDCHHTIMDRSTAKLAHNLPLAVREKLVLTSTSTQQDDWHDLAPGPAVDQENVECNACHREHRGADADLLAISDAQCQTCHADRFGSFASSHPDWDRWPYGRGRKIAFNHSTHANKHFPATKQGDSVAQFQCADCHRRRDDNELTRATTFQRACKSCHDESLRLETAEGIELLALPTLPTESAGQVQPWPEEATGFYDGRVAPLTGLLMRTDSAFTHALRQIPNHDFSRLDESESEAVAAGLEIAKAHRGFLKLIAQRGQPAIIERAANIGVAPTTLSAFVRSLPPQLLRSADRKWFANSSDIALRSKPFQFPLAAKPDQDLLLEDDSDDLLAGDDVGGDSLLGEDSDTLLLGDDPLTDPLADPLSEDPLAAGVGSSAGNADSSTDFDPDSMLPEGGWFRDDLRMAIRYRGGGHSDPVLKSTIDMISQLPASDLARQQLLKTQAIAACVSCHPGAIESQQGWHSQPLIGERREFTKFSHGPHLNVAQLADCSHCHQISSSAEQNSSDITTVSGGFHSTDPGDFQKMSRAACASCHTPLAAGDSCITCHRYHIDLK